MYKYRSLSCVGNKFYVAGIDNELNAGGILEWCYSLEDAHERYNLMREHDRFTGLTIGVED